jgi:predicted phosphoribosyltransferase
VGEWYEEFPQVAEAEVIELLAAARRLAEERAEGEKKG